MSSWVSVREVTFAELVVVAIVVVLLEFLDHVVHQVEALGHGPLERDQPVRDRPQRPGVQPVEPLPPFVPHPHEPHLAKHPQVLGDERLGQAERLDELRHRPLPAGEQVEDLPPPGLGHRVERVGGGRRPCHA
jgi:hypothetical protein